MPAGDSGEVPEVGISDRGGHDNSPHVNTSWSPIEALCSRGTHEPQPAGTDAFSNMGAFSPGGTAVGSGVVAGDQTGEGDDVVAVLAGVGVE